MTEKIKELFKKALESIKSSNADIGELTYLYQDEDGVIHMGSDTGMRWLMSAEFYEALLKLKDLPPVKEYKEPKERVYKNIKPYYQKERW